MLTIWISPQLLAHLDSVLHEHQPCPAWLASRYTAHLLSLWGLVHSQCGHIIRNVLSLKAPIVIFLKWTSDDVLFVIFFYETKTYTMTSHVLHNQAWTHLWALRTPAPQRGPEEDSILMILRGLFVYKIFLNVFLAELGQEPGILTDFRDVDSGHCLQNLTEFWPYGHFLELCPSRLLCHSRAGGFLRLEEVMLMLGHSEVCLPQVLRSDHLIHFLLVYYKS